MMGRDSKRRAERRAWAEETVSICQAGQYRAPDATDVSIGVALDEARRGTETLFETRSLPRAAGGRFRTRITLTDETTLEAGARLARGVDGAERVFGRGKAPVPRRPVLLNFASARNPGGGFLTGAEAQEESLARSSGLYWCVHDQPLYEANRAERNPLYRHHLIYSPPLPFFRDDEGRLLAAPWYAAVITAPAVNAGVARKRRISPRRIERVMRERIDRVLRLAVYKGHRQIVLGAWGCGVFRNEPKAVARWFREALEGDFRGAFEHVLFAVYDPYGRGVWEAFSGVLDPVLARG